MSYSLLIGATLASSGISMIVLQRVNLYNYLQYRDRLVRDNADLSVIKVYDDWLNSGFVHQLLTKPIIHKD